MNNSDYYKILNISKPVTNDDIKKAYRKLAIKWHPDKNNNSKVSEEMFKKIAEAYSVLSDNNKRRQYDLRSDGSLDGGLVFDFNTAEQLFSNMFNSPFHSFNFNEDDIQSSNRRTGNIPSYSRTYSTSTTTINGKTISKTTTTIKHPDGRVETTHSTNEPNRPDFRDDSFNFFLHY